MLTLKGITKHYAAGDSKVEALRGVNLEFGKRLARHADIVIVIGKHNAEMLINGLTDGLYRGRSDHP